MSTEPTVAVDVAVEQLDGIESMPEAQRVLIVDAVDPVMMAMAGFNDQPIEVLPEDDLPWHPKPADRAAAQAWAKDLLARWDWVILDTETTGLGPKDQVVSVSIISHGGEVLLDTLVKPTIHIPDEVVRIHGIDDARVAHAPTFAEVLPDILGIIADHCTDRRIICYNVAFDRRVLEQSAAAHGLFLPDLQWHCAMLAYAAFVGDWNAGKSDYTWQKLPNAAHSSLSDCIATLELVKTMAEGPKATDGTRLLKAYTDAMAGWDAFVAGNKAILDERERLMGEGVAASDRLKVWVRDHLAKLQNERFLVEPQEKTRRWLDAAALLELEPDLRKIPRVVQTRTFVDEERVHGLVKLGILDPAPVELAMRSEPMTTAVFITEKKPEKKRAAKKAD